jgi:hypothetical protein
LGHAPLPIEPQRLLYRLQRHPLGTGPLVSPVKQTLIAVLLVAPFPTLHAPRRNPQNLGRLQPQNLPTHRSQNHFLYFHCPLRSGQRIKCHGSSKEEPLSTATLYRTFHLLSPPDTSFAYHTNATDSCSQRRSVVSCVSARGSQ